MRNEQRKNPAQQPPNFLGIPPVKGLASVEKTAEALRWHREDNKDHPPVDVLKSPGVWASEMHPLEHVPGFNATGDLPTREEVLRGYVPEASSDIPVVDRAEEVPQILADVDVDVDVVSVSPDTEDDRGHTTQRSGEREKLGAEVPQNDDGEAMTERMPDAA